MPNVTMTNPEGERLIYINQNVPVGTLNSDEILNAELLERVQVFWKVKGQQTDGKLQGTHTDNPQATDWFDIQALSAGLNPIVEVCVDKLRIQLVQSLNAQANELSLFGAT